MIVIAFMFDCVHIGVMQVSSVSGHLDSGLMADSFLSNQSDKLSTVGDKPIRLPGSNKKYTDDEISAIGAKICALVASGSNLTNISRLDGFPALEAIYRWLKSNDEFSKAYSHARELRSDARADRIDDYKEQMLLGLIPSDIARVAIETEKWQASKENPKKYGDKQQVDLNATFSLSALVEEAVKLKDITPRLTADSAQLIDYKPNSGIADSDSISNDASNSGAAESIMDYL